MTTIRTATITDAATIATIGKRSFLESHGHSASAKDIESYTSRKYTAEALQQELADSGNIYHLIFYKDQIAGYSKIKLNTGNENIAATSITCLDRIYLLKDFYDLKLGAALLNHNIALSQQHDQAGIWLYTWTENTRAVAFYHKAGFNIVGSANFSISPTHANPNHVMYLTYF
ncbi:GNAT family N-acetyltransferase [Flavipsychrobacter stenotrophus]|uniref:GNAT family N-acetyltransferase n=1 Tax=Flavipsychrobacter stenotrophus TaxID=2077091 RepID=A0A2S7SY21_9BACT|nr:GNAT family N-acetyltransferase [Flavipsychrobacter stenotrophus]PQJ11830.1 GNAT family N-acetyltransferase [Flavipsychrobacter stenotrophus]